MALGVDTAATWHLNARSARRKEPALVFRKKIACQFTADQFHKINSFADGKGISFAAAVRRLIFEIGPFRKEDAA